MFAELMGDYGSRLLVAVIGVGLALVCLVGILWIVRGRKGPSPFVRGGRNRQPRLQVLDAAAVDARRRLVLVRRDDVEHLIMIGGPTDIVIESRISPASSNGEIWAPEQSAAAITHSPQPHAEPVQATTARPLPRQATAKDIIRETPMQDFAARELGTRELPTRNAITREARQPSQPTPPVAPAAAAEPRPAAQPAAINRQEPAVRPPQLDDAARLLDSQRDRVFADRGAAPAAAAPAAPAPSARPIATPAPAVANPAPLGSDFDKILEQEMANNMAAREQAAIGGRTSAPTAALPAGSASAQAATKSDPSLQSEVARIFGEMSATRDK